ncbi:MAG TPA: exodeoxyribonuclease VII small subunit [Patescibacteria group bacterium]|jgi:exodeoxyribonuclease VII small subunit|nr:exodeoxyribonuclease VII small subunit [Patescibacteria group bacterium]
MTTKIENYAELNDELENILTELQNPSTDIDQALILYKRGQELIKQLQVYLDKSKNIIKKINKIDPSD